MTDSIFTFHVDRPTKDAFMAMAAAQNLSAAQVLRQMMHDALEEHRKLGAHEAWARRQIGQAMSDTNALKTLHASNDMARDDWALQRKEIERRGER